MPQLPPYPQGGQPIEAAWGRLIIDYMKALTASGDGSQIKVEFGSGGTQISGMVDESASSQPWSCSYDSDTAVWTLTTNFWQRSVLPFNPIPKSRIVKVDQTYKFNNTMTIAGEAQKVRFFWDASRDDPSSAAALLRWQVGAKTLTPADVTGADAQTIGQNDDIVNSSNHQFFNHLVDIKFYQDGLCEIIAPFGSSLDVNRPIDVIAPNTDAAPLWVEYFGPGTRNLRVGHIRSAAGGTDVDFIEHVVPLGFTGAFQFVAGYNAGGSYVVAALGIDNTYNPPIATVTGVQPLGKISIDGAGNLIYIQSVTTTLIPRMGITHVQRFDDGAGGKFDMFFQSGSLTKVTTTTT